MLTDQYGRRFQYLRLSVTDVCNFKCNYCLPDGYQCDGRKQHLQLNEIATLLQAFANLGLKKVRLTGGEPTLRRDIADIVQVCANTKGIEQVAMTTNGYRLEQQIDELVAAGLTSVNISLDSLDPASFIAITGHNQFAKVMAGVDKALTAGLASVKLNAVLLKQFNFAQLQQNLAWLRTRNVSYRFIELMETGDNKRFFADNHVSGEALKQQLLQQGWQPVIRHQLAGPAQEFYHPESAGRVGLIMPYSKDFCASCNRLRVSSTGQLQMCLFAEHGVDLRGALSANDVAQTEALLLQAMSDKVEAHDLLSHQTGGTKQFAQIGG